MIITNHKHVLQISAVILVITVMSLLLLTNGCTSTAQFSAGASAGYGRDFELTGAVAGSPVGSIVIGSATIVDDQVYLFYVMAENDSATDELALHQFTIDTDSGTSELLTASVLMRLEGITVGVLKLRLVPGATEYSVRPQGASTAPVALRRFTSPYEHGGITQLNVAMPALQRFASPYGYGGITRLNVTTPDLYFPYRIYSSGEAIFGPGIQAFSLVVHGPYGKIGDIALSISKTGDVDTISFEELTETVRDYVRNSKVE